MARRRRKSYYDDYWPRYETSDPIRVEDGIVAKSQRGKFAQNWWADRWIAALERLMDPGRLSRGRSYARHGQVIEIVFSTGIAILVWAGSIPQPSISDISLGAILHLPQQPSIAQMSELVFQLKQAFDAFVVRALGVVLPAGAAEVVGILLSVNMLTGFVSALYASIIAAGVRSAEDALL